MIMLFLLDTTTCINRKRAPSGWRFNEAGAPMNAMMKAFKWHLTTFCIGILYSVMVFLMVFGSMHIFSVQTVRLPLLLRVSIKKLYYFCAYKYCTEIK